MMAGLPGGEGRRRTVGAPGGRLRGSRVFESRKAGESRKGGGGEVRSRPLCEETPSGSGHEETFSHSTACIPACSRLHLYVQASDAHHVTPLVLLSAPAGFTSMSKQVQPELVMAFLNQ